MGNCIHRAGLSWSPPETVDLDSSLKLLWLQHCRYTGIWIHLSHKAHIRGVGFDTSLLILNSQYYHHWHGPKFESVILVPKHQTVSGLHQSKHRLRATGRHTSDMTSFISTLTTAQTQRQLQSLSCRLSGRLQCFGKSTRTSCRNVMRWLCASKLPLKTFREGDMFLKEWPRKDGLSSSICESSDASCLFVFVFI